MRLRRFHIPALLVSALLAGAAFAAEVPQSQQQITLSFAPVVKQATPAVVNIYTRTRVQVRDNISPFMHDPFFRQFFGQNFAFGGRTREQLVSSLGSGVIVAGDGTIVTAHHVVKDAQEIKVALPDKREFDAKVTKRDPQSDLVFLKIEADGKLPYLEMRNSDSLEVGELVLAIGNPFNVGQTVTQGIISALARQAAGVSDYAFFIQTDAAINPGNSGGALVDMQGRLIGINTAIYSTSGASNGIGFAIPSNMVRSFMESKAEGGKVVRPWLGLAVQPMTGDMAESQGLAAPQGVIIRKIWKDSPAEKAGLKTGDVVLAVGGNTVASEQDLHYRTALSRIGESSDFKILRGGKEETVAVTMQAPPEMPKRDQRTLAGRHPLDGVTVANLSPALALELSMDNLEQEGIVVMKGGKRGVGGSFAPGDIIQSINGTEITSTTQLEQLLKNGGRDWQIVYVHQGRQVSLTVRM